MPAVCRIGDSLTTGHGCTGVTTIADSNTDHTVFANGINILVNGAPTVSHTIPAGDCVPHVDVTKSGSGTVFINGTPVNRIGDSADAGAMISGSGNVFVGD